MFETTLSEQDFARLSELICSTWGIKMPPTKKGMLEGRLVKRLRILGMKSLDEYCRYLFGPDGKENEVIFLIDVVSTNKTDFFREPSSFSHLVQRALPKLVANRGAGVKKKLMVWSAGCSTGEEPYTLAMFLQEFGLRYPGLGFDYSILATDVSISALETAKRGIYPHDRVESVPMDFRQKYLLKSKERSKDLVRINPLLRSKVRFRHLNLMSDFGLRELMDIIYCRNVIIYFDRPTQERLFLRFCRQLKPDGYIYVGHSETLTGMNLPLVNEVPTVYCKAG